MIKQLVHNAYTEYAEDLPVIQQALFDHGYEASLSDCQLMWQKYSDRLDAQWIGTESYSSDEIFEELKEYILN